MWRLLLSGLFCVPALILLVQWHDKPVPESRATNPPPAGVATSNAAPPAIRLSLPPVQFSSVPALPDDASWGAAGPAVSIPLQEVASQASIVEPVEPSVSAVTAPTNVAMRHHRPSASGHRAVAVAAIKPEPHDDDHSVIMAFFSRNLTRYSFAPPDQNGGG
jgi:hypothetical protein